MKARNLYPIFVLVLMLFVIAPASGYQDPTVNQPVGGQSDLPWGGELHATPGGGQSRLNGGGLFLGASRLLADFFSQSPYLKSKLLILNLTDKGRNLYRNSTPFISNRSISIANYGISRKGN